MAPVLVCDSVLPQHEGRPYCHVPCYGYLFGPKGVNIGDVGCYVYNPDGVQPEREEGVQLTGTWANP